MSCIKFCIKKSVDAHVYLPPGVKLGGSKDWYISNTILHWNGKVDSILNVTPWKWKEWSFFRHFFKPFVSEKCDPCKWEVRIFVIFSGLSAFEKCDPLQVKSVNFLLVFFSGSPHVKSVTESQILNWKKKLRRLSSTLWPCNGVVLRHLMLVRSYLLKVYWIQICTSIFWSRICFLVLKN